METIAKYKPQFIPAPASRRHPEPGGDSRVDPEIRRLRIHAKSHSTRYAIIAFQTAFLKVYHPVEYMAALLTDEIGSTEKVVQYIEECRRMTQSDGTGGITVLPPDVNLSDKDFTPAYVKEGHGKRHAEKVTGVEYHSG